MIIVGYALGWFGTTAPSAADWLTATSTAVLAFAAPVSIWLVGQQIASAQATAEDERHFVITPVITIRVHNNGVMTGDIPRQANWIRPIDPDNLQRFVQFRVGLVGTGAALQVQVTFIPFTPANLHDYLKVTNFPPTVSPSFYPHLAPDDKDDILTCTWARSTPFGDKANGEFAMFFLTFYFRNSLARWYMQQFLLIIYASGLVAIQGGTAPTPIKQPTPHDLIPLNFAIDDYNAEQAKES